MKRALFTVFLGLALAWPAMGQDPLYENDGVVTNAIAIDAITFVNNGIFEIPVTGVDLNTNISLNDIILLNPTVGVYDFSDVVNYTNRGIMSCDTGFNFDTAPSDFGVRHMAANFVNANPGQIFSGTLNTSFNNNFFLIIPAKLNISASNVVNSGTLDVGLNGLLTIEGGSVNLTRGSLHVEGIDDLSSFVLISGTNITPFQLGIFSRYWGIGVESNLLTLANVTLPASSPRAQMTNFFGPLFVTLSGLPAAFANTNILNTNDFTYQVVFVGDAVGQTAIDVRFQGRGNPGYQGNGDFAAPIIQWSSLATNPFNGQISTNTVYLTDTLGEFTNALFLVTNNAFGLSQPQVFPTNYVLFRSLFGFNSLPTGNATYSPTLFSNAFDTNAPFSTTNQYTGYGADILPVTFAPTPNLPGSTLTNVGGRIELTADTVMDLTRAKVTGPNYLRLTSTNHWAGSSNAEISVPFIDLNLGSTNGNMDITNVIAPFITHINGGIGAYSAKWTNTFMSNAVVTNMTGGTTNVTTNSFTVTNRFHVLMVASFLSNTAPVFSQNVALRSTNVIISDMLNVSNTLSIDAQNLTITTNDPTAVTPFGELNLVSPEILWSASLPTLQNLTNFGQIRTLNSVFFQKRLNANFPSPSDGPYQTFVNHGVISTAGETIWANYFENSGPSGANPSITASFGPINVLAATALMTNGTFTAFGGDITIGGGSIFIENQTLIALAGALNLNVTNQLTDGGAVGNLFQVSDGISMSIKPTSGDLLGTTVMIQAPAGVEVPDVWAGADLGAVAAGYSNNAAVGHLVLSGGDVNSAFHFSSPGATNAALYVDLLEFQGSTSNAAALDIDPHMTIYFVKALIGNADISGLLDGANNGRMHKVSGFVGLFNTGNLSGGGMKLSITTTNLPPMEALISWPAVPNATNGLYSSTNAGGSNWTLVTNLVQGASSSVLAVPQPIQANGPVFYKVRINPIH